MMLRLQQLFDRLQAYPGWQVAVELLVIWLVVYAAYRFLQGTRAAGIIKGFVVVLLVGTLLVRVLGERDAFQRLKVLYDSFLTVAALGFVIIFQPELRRALTRLGEAPLFRRGRAAAAEVSEEIADACGYLSKARFGGLIVIEREVGLRGLVEGGTPIEGRVSAALLQTIFFPGSALHDLAVVIKDQTVTAAGVQLPLAEPGEMPDPSLGSRHRAAVGLTRECDALAIVVSEETGGISLAERGRLLRGLKADGLRIELERRLSGRAADTAPAVTPEAGAPARSDAAPDPGARPGPPGDAAAA
ncbi:MAG: TIGR00159 family protein [Phycisphaerae bacterium]|nr:TIGR00159 family protein [Phycisphaerae bacterium]